MEWQISSDWECEVISSDSETLHRAFVSSLRPHCSTPLQILVGGSKYPFPPFPEWIATHRSDLFKQSNKAQQRNTFQYDILESRKQFIWLLIRDLGTLDLTVWNRQRVGLWWLRPGDLGGFVRKLPPIWATDSEILNPYGDLLVST